MAACDLLARFADVPVLVVGDLVLDEYVWGTVSRVSPEAPVPVVEVQERSFAAGGAANAAANVAGLGGRVVLVGIVGADRNGERLRECACVGRVCADGVFTDPTRPTTTKTRVVACGQQVVRLDREDTTPVEAAMQEALLTRVREQLRGVRGCILSDYGKGVVTREVAAGVIRAAAAAGVPVVVDPKGPDYRKYRGAAVVKPNQAEAGLALGRPLPDSAAVAAAGQDLVAKLGGRTAVLVTRGPDGMDLFVPGRPVAHVPARAREVYDVTGAGDTVTAALGISLATEVPLEDACRLAAEAAAVVVGRRGTIPVARADLLTRR